MAKITFIHLICFLLLIPPLAAQEKYEREYRLKVEEVPSLAIDFIEACNFSPTSCLFSSGLKWYGEESLDGHSVEAKLKEGDLFYSIEFDTLGHLEDVEIDVTWTQLPEPTRKQIEGHLNQQFEKFRLIKIQKQWAGERETILELIRTGKTRAPFTTKYEIVLKGKTNLGWTWYEFLFSEDGTFEKKSTIIFRNTDNLDY